MSQVVTSGQEYNSQESAETRTIYPVNDVDKAILYSNSSRSESASDTDSSRSQGEYAL